MRELLLLLTVALKAWRNTLLRPASGRRSLPGGGALFLLLLMGGMAFGASRLLSVVQNVFVSRPDLVSLARAALVTNAALGAFLFMFMLGVRDVYESLYQSPDLAFLLASPLRPAAIYLSRLLSTSAVSLTAALPLGLGAVVGAGAAAGAPLWYYPAALLALVLAALLFCSAASLLILPFMRWVSARRLRQALLSLSLLASLAFVFLTQWASTWGGSQTWTNPTLAASRLLAASRAGWLPHGWLARAWLGPLEGRPGALGLGILALGLGAAALGAVSWWASGKAWVAGWERGQGLEGPRPRRAPRTGAASSPAASPGPGLAPGGGAGPRPAAQPRPAALGAGRAAGPSPLWALASSELRLFSREPMAWYGLGVMAVVSGFLAYSLSRESPSELGGITNVAFVFAVLLVMAGSWSRLRLAPMSPRDPAFWVLRTSPVEPRRLYWSKFLALFLPALALVTAIYLGCSLLFGLDLDLGACLGFSAPVLAAVASVGLWLEIRFPSLAAPRPGRAAGGSRASSLLASLASMLAALVVAGSAVVPWFVWAIPAAGRAEEIGGLVAGWCLPLAVAGAMTWAAAWDGTRQLEAICRGRQG